MSNRKKIASIAFTGAAATATTFMATGSAVAAASWHVKNGGVPYVSVFNGTKIGASPSLKDVSTGALLKCRNAIVSGLISKSRSAAASPKLGLLRKSVTKWSSCSAAGLRYIAHLTTSPALIAQAFAGGVTTGKLAGSPKISGKISGVGGNTCRAFVSGASIPLRYTNAAHSLSLDPARVPTLRVRATSGNCHGQLVPGTKAFIHGTYHASVPPAPHALTISRS